MAWEGVFSGELGWDSRNDGKVTKKWSELWSVVGEAVCEGWFAILGLNASLTQPWVNVLTFMFALSNFVWW
ncbi:hypothetical protein Y032_0219g2477 [Ancylostoma ceylanicum]|uniref:Uncharacterized protein n=1 Tax=Ancylostoma ceylanicum TaxID=53326 RepID=A0A016SJN6_9BILA|nr:hypothetical protein Y032_0219g2477 [Ancylostoma ceylanicum]